MIKVNLTATEVGREKLTEFDGHIFECGIQIIGNITYYGPEKGWRCLANVNGCLAVIQVRVYRKDTDGYNSLATATTSATTNDEKSLSSL
jgi:hypothetical protein